MISSSSVTTGRPVVVYKPTYNVSLHSKLSYIMRLLFVVLFVCFVLCESFDMFIGDTVHRKMVFHQRVKDFAIPFKKRIKVLTYNDPEKRIIKGVAAIDNDFSHATANITDGGVGFSHVTVRMKSQRHHPLNFELEIYV